MCLCVGHRSFREAPSSSFIMSVTGTAPAAVLAATPSDQKQLPFLPGYRIQTVPVCNARTPLSAQPRSVFFPFLVRFVASTKLTSGGFFVLFALGVGWMFVDGGVWRWCVV